MWVSTEGCIGGQARELACSAQSVVSPGWNGIKALVQQLGFWQEKAGAGTITPFDLHSIPLLLAFQKQREGCVQEQGDVSLPRSDLDLIRCSGSTKRAKSILAVAGSEGQGGYRNLPELALGNALVGPR